MLLAAALLAGLLPALAPARSAWAQVPPFFAPPPESAGGPATADGPARARRAADSTPAAGDTTIPVPVGYVNDRAGVLDESTRARLEAFLAQVKDKCGVQFAVLTTPGVAPLDPLQYKTDVYQRWFHGNRTSLLLLVAMAERRIAFETGYELEGILPDGLEARIIRDEMTPRFRAGDVPGGVVAGVLRAAAVIAKDRGVTLEWNGEELRYDQPSRRRGTTPGALILFIVLSVLASLVRSFGWRRHSRGGWWIGPGMGGWGGGFGGGFGGGGGGGGFGGFGGGGGFGSGGGGGSGSW